MLGLLLKYCGGTKYFLLILLRDQRLDKKYLEPPCSRAAINTYINRLLPHGAVTFYYLDKDSTGRNLVLYHLSPARCRHLHPSCVPPRTVSPLTLTGQLTFLTITWSGVTPGGW